MTKDKEQTVIYKRLQNKSKDRVSKGLFFFMISEVLVSFIKITINNI